MAFPLTDLGPEVPTDLDETSNKRHLQVVDPDVANPDLASPDVANPDAAIGSVDAIEPDTVDSTSSAAAVQRSARSAKVARLLNDLSTCTDPVRRLQIQEEVALATLPVARSIASRYRGRGVDVGDLEQIAALGLVKAVRRWKCGLSEDFLQYAVPTITGEIKRYFRDSWWTVRPPRRLQEARAAMTQAEQDLRQRSGQEPDEKTLAAELGLDIRTVRQAKEVRQSARPTSLEDPAADNGQIDRAVADEDTELRHAEERIAVQALLATLGARDRTVIDMRFYRGWSQAKIGEHIGVSQMQVSRILRDIFKTLRKRWEA